jgi:hypothetical protein
MTFKEVWEHIPEGVKHVADALSVTTMLGTLFQMLPNIAALLTIVWTFIRIYETGTVQRLLKREK